MGLRAETCTTFARLGHWFWPTGFDLVMRTFMDDRVATTGMRRGEPPLMKSMPAMAFPKD